MPRRKPRDLKEMIERAYSHKPFEVDMVLPPNYMLALLMFANDMNLDVKTCVETAVKFYFDTVGSGYLKQANEVIRKKALEKFLAKN